MAEEQQKMSESEKKKEDWMNSKWRPMMGWMYMSVCACDFMLFPVLWSLLQATVHGAVNTQWQPLTLQGAGLFHVAMGAVLGIAAYGRTQEKLNGANNGGITLPSNVGTTYTPPAPIGQPSPGSVNAPAVSSGFGSQPLGGGVGSSAGFGAPTSGSFNPAPSWGTTPVSTAPTVVTGFGGKKAPPDPVFPEI